MLDAAEKNKGSKNTAQEGGVRYSFAGEKAKTADLSALERAKEMEKQGVAAETIRRETGWFTGADGKWRFEIDDSRAEYRRDGDAQLMKEPEYRRLQELTQKWADSLYKGTEALTGAEINEIDTLQEQYSDRIREEKHLLRDFLRHDVLFEAYPRLKGVNLAFDYLDFGTNGYFDEMSNTVVLSHNLLGSNKRTLLHEIQHVIQKYEGFARGGSIEYWNRKMEDGYSKKWDSGEEMMPSELYLNSAGEIEARDTANRRKLTAEERRAKAPDTGDENTVFADGDAIVGMHEETEEDKRAKPAGREESKTMRAADPRNMARYKAEVYAAIDGTMKSGEQILIGKPSDILEKYMKSDNPLYMPQTAAKKAALTKEDGGKHGLGMVVLEELPYQLEDPLAITGNTSRHKAFNDDSIVVWTDWMTEKGDSVIVPIRIDIEGTIEVYNGVNTMFDVFNEEYKNDLLRDGNVLYTKNGKSIDDLLLQRRQVPKVQTNNALSEDSIRSFAENSNTQNAAALEKVRYSTDEAATSAEQLLELARGEAALKGLGVEPNETIEEKTERWKQEKERRTEERTRTKGKEEFKGTEDLEKLGVKVAGDVTMGYEMTKSMREWAKAEKQGKRAYLPRIRTSCPAIG